MAAEPVFGAERAMPRATYRLQLRPGFGFADAGALAGYLAALGVSHVYLSPFLQAATGSTHGYDIIDHGRVNEELGGAEAHAAMCRAFAEHGLSQVLDVVPNHMSIASRDNRWWRDVLENGPASRYALHFDVDWIAAEERLADKVLLPILGDHYGRVIAAGAVAVVRHKGGFFVKVYEDLLPVAPISLAAPLRVAAARAGSDELGFYADALADLPDVHTTERVMLERRERDRRVAYAAIERLLEERPALSEIVDATLEELGKEPERLDAFLEQQHYRLAYWRIGRHDLDYRRFFDIDTLAALRTERGEVFEAVHRLPLRWVAEGVAEGLRIDHPDGLRDPADYFERLRGAAPRAWIVAEKILEPDESLPPWPVDGTTGYDALRLLDGVFVERSAEPELDAIYEEVVGEPVPDFGELLRACKRQVLREMLGSDLERVTGVFVALCEAAPYYRDFARAELRELLEEVVVHLECYRTYIAPGRPPSPGDVAALSRALDAAHEARPDLDADLFTLLSRLAADPGRGPRANELFARLQQLSAPAAAKGVEDTALYRHHRLVCLNEVGGDPRRFGCSVGELHAHFAHVQATFPVTMIGTSTHDTKRGEDVRLRLALLTHEPAAWRRFALEASARSRRYGERVDAPTRYLFLQTAVGAWPIDEERLTGYLRKAAREAKLHTSWTRPDEAYEQALETLVREALADEVFVSALRRFVEPLAERACRASLAQALLKTTVPGVPDIYQGAELWALSLTDPDNRRPVDFALRRRLLEELNDLGPEDAMARAREGLPKLWLLARALQVRARSPQIFGRTASYQPLEAGEHAVAFCRSGALVTAVPTRFFRHEGAMVLPAGRWRDVLGGGVHSGGAVALDELWRRFPVALLLAEDAR